MTILWELDPTRAERYVLENFGGRVRAFYPVPGDATTETMPFGTGQYGGTPVAATADAKAYLDLNGNGRYYTPPALVNPTPPRGFVSTVLRLPTTLTVEQSVIIAWISGASSSSSIALSLGQYDGVHSIYATLNGSILASRAVTDAEKDGQWHVWTVEWDGPAGLLRVLKDGAEFLRRASTSAFEVPVPDTVGWSVPAGMVPITPTAHLAGARMEDVAVIDPVAQSATMRSAYLRVPQVTLNWTAVANGGTPVTGYRIRYVQAGVMMDARVGPDVLSYALPGEYAGPAWVSALNAVGESAPTQVTV